MLEVVGRVLIVKTNGEAVVLVVFKVVGSTLIDTVLLVMLSTGRVLLKLLVDWTVGLTCIVFSTVTVTSEVVVWVDSEVVVSVSVARAVVVSVSVAVSVVVMAEDGSTDGDTDDDNEDEETTEETVTMVVSTSVEVRVLVQKKFLVFETFDEEALELELELGIEDDKEELVELVELDEEDCKLSDKRVLIKAKPKIIVRIWMMPAGPLVVL